MSTEVMYQRVNAQMERYDRCIAEAEGRIEAQEQLIREATLVGRPSAQESFNLQKLQLVVAILREARERMYGRTPSQRPRSLAAPSASG